MFFDSRRQARRLHATCCHYEDQLMHKNTQIRQTEELLKEMRTLLENADEINNYLASENKRISENADVDSDMMNEMFIEYRDAMRRLRELEKLEEENYKLWTENTLLRAELTLCRPDRAYEIGRTR